MKKLVLGVGWVIIFTAACSSDKAANQDCSAGCLIANICYPEGSFDPSQSCQKCNRAQSATAWSNDTGAACDDGVYCTEQDSCLAGVCGGVARAPDDGVACNGVESCDESSQAIVSTGNQCGSGQLCDFQSDSCIDLCPGCLIAEVCYGAGQQNPENPCLQCDPLLSTTEWQNNDGGACSDGLFCTKDDTCAGGSCSGLAMQADDGISCNGVETCDEVGQTVVSTGNQCGPDQFCDLISDSCVGACPGCLIDGVCYGEEQVNPENACQICRVLVSSTTWVEGNGDQQEGVCACHEGWSGRICDEIKCAIRVATDGDDINAGSSWAEAQLNIQHALDDALDQGCDVWVKAGTYTENITLVANVGLYGSFVGTEESLSQRTIATVTVVDREMPDPTSIIDGNNSGSVVSCFVNGATALLDGFVITKGRTIARGGGMFNNETDVTVRNCYFHTNQASEGGGMYNHRTYSTISNCRFSGNSAAGGVYTGNGAGIYNNDSSPNLSNCIFTTNVAGGNGGGVYNNRANPLFRACTLDSNRAGPGADGIMESKLGKKGGSGAGMYNTNSAPVLIDCLFHANLAGAGGIGYPGYAGAAESARGTGATGGLGGDGGAMYNSNSSLELINCILWENVAGKGGRGGYGRFGTNDYRYGGNGGSGNVGGNGGGIYSADSALYIFNSIIYQNVSGAGGNGGWGGNGYVYSYSAGRGGPGVGSGDGAGLYNSNASPQLVNSILYDSIIGLGGTGGSGGRNPNGTYASSGADGAADGLGSWAFLVNNSELDFHNSIVWTGTFEIVDTSSLTVNFTNIMGGWTGKENLNLRPRFVDAANGNFRLDPISPGINEGNKVVLPPDTYDIDGDNDTSEDFPTDLAGATRIKGFIDMGPYEQ